MKVDYAGLRGAASGLLSAASAVSGEQGVPSVLLSGASGPNGAHADGSGDRRQVLTRLATVLRAEGRACADVVTLFQALDAQVASRTALG
ncbi:hypothetical protein [Leifsonia sp. NPDC080035]|uniref:Uncharacterized protein n=1 Tax=Leifsonia sp. NPDC080035 TaxID=3143936 RepID=A0AAU7GJ77_9MICO